MKRIVFLAAAIFPILTTGAPAFAGEVMTDRCSSEVAIVPAYTDQPITSGTVLLTRDASGQTPWSKPFKVQTGGGGLTGSGFIRWWCHSTTGNVLILVLGDRILTLLKLESVWLMKSE